MPKKNQHIQTARIAGKNPAPGKKGQRSVCRQGAGPAPAAAGQRNTFSTVRFCAKPGTEVFFKREGIPDNGGAEKLYDDLFRVYRTAHRIIRGTPVKVNPAEHLPLHSALAFVLSEFGGLLPHDWNFNIELDDKTGEHYFTAFRVGDAKWGFSFFAVKKALEKLSRESPGLHELFLTFIAALGRIAGIDIICSGLIDNTFCYLEDRFSEMRDDVDSMKSEELIDLAKDIHTYTKGQARRYMSLVKHMRQMAPRELMHRANRFKKAAPIANLIYEGCQLLEEGTSLLELTYFPVPPEEGFDVSLCLDSQFAVMWDEDDSLACEHSECTDAYANEGIQEPVVSLSIKPETKQIDFALLDKKIDWPHRLGDFFDRAYEYIHNYTDNEQKN